MLPGNLILNIRNHFAKIQQLISPISIYLYPKFGTILAEADDIIALQWPNPKWNLSRILLAGPLKRNCIYDTNWDMDATTIMRVIVHNHNYTFSCKAAINRATTWSFMSLPNGAFIFHLQNCLPTLRRLLTCVKIIWFSLPQLHMQYAPYCIYTCTYK